MKHLAATLAALALAATITAAIAYRSGDDKHAWAALAQTDAMEWLRAEFGLTDAQYATLKTLHDEYSVVCEEHCRAIQDAARLLRGLKQRQATGAEIAAAERDVQHLRLVCESAIASHVRRCAAEMSPEAGRRYLALVLPKIKDFDHTAPPDLGLHRHSH